MINRLNNSYISTKQPINNTKNQSFKGPSTALIAGLRGLNNSPALGACGVDLCSMVIPRSVIEFKNRGLQSGIETAVREGTSCFIHACVGLIGLGAATLISGGFNEKYGIKAQNIFASGDTIKNMSEIWKNSNGQSTEFFSNFLNNLNGLNGKNWNTVSKKANKEISENLGKLAEKTANLANATGKDKSHLAKEARELRKLILAKITKDTGAQASFKLKGINGTKEISSSIGELVDNAVTLSNTFKTKSSDKLPEFVKALTKNKTASTLLGLGICAALCISIQPINRYLTKKRTGQDGFVGVEDKKGNTSENFKKLKTFFGIAFPAFAISTIGKPADFISNVQFNSKIPTLKQFKFLYGLTIGSRFLAARDGNELRECVIKDTLGFTNWLILGGMVSKLTARAIGGKELINNPIAKESGTKGIKYALKWLTKSSVKTFDEVLLPKSKEIVKDGKLKNFTNLVKNADSATKSKIFKIAGSQIAGYLYSGIVLGVGIAKLNIFITKQVQAKNKAKEEIKNNVISTPNDKYNMTFISNIDKESSSVFKDFN